MASTCMCTHTVHNKTNWKCNVFFVSSMKCTNRTGTRGTAELWILKLAAMGEGVALWERTCLPTEYRRPWVPFPTSNGIKTKATMVSAAMLQQTISQRRELPCVLPDSCIPCHQDDHKQGEGLTVTHWDCTTPTSGWAQDHLPLNHTRRRDRHQLLHVSCVLLSHCHKCPADGSRVLRHKAPLPGLCAYSKKAGVRRGPRHSSPHTNQLYQSFGT